MTKTKNKRRKSDFYPTPLPLAQAAMSLLPVLPDRPRVLDPGAGEGIWGKALLAEYPDARITGVDIDPHPVPAGYAHWIRNDYTLMPYFFGNQDLVIGNPPFSLAEQFVHQALRHTRNDGYVFFILRLTFLETPSRYTLFRAHPPRKVWVMPSRVSFMGNKHTDFTTHAFFLWEKGYTGETRLDWFDWQSVAQKPVIKLARAG